ncbi:MAP7 domain-containing protein 3 isoform X3 [Ictidomys tridecemlineatus]|uniref:MAP7 domain-containing protein 3 isoform X2 n=1 Tax=Ictidomys tridecemlineatus TaxID=43179 RepID=UPI001A9DC78D|nr:MAP7 domain-containing protein 3 isoform X2 [Ictidomys tridecemlineatus]
MADHTVAGPSGSTSLRGLRERMVAAAQAVAKERRDQSGVSSFSSQSPTIRSAFKPVIDGSVLKNDLKQKLAKERREERKRQQEASKEIQLLEKERKAKLQYEKHLEEKQRKLREQKEKDERRRVSAEEKRKQKFEEEREKYKAVLSRTLERTNRVDQRQKRWSWEGSAMANSENKPGKPENKRSSSLNRRENKVHSSTDLEHMEDKTARRFYSNPSENNLISRLLIPTRASVARSKTAASLSIPGKDTPGVTNHFLQYVHMPLRSHSSDELKSSIMFSKPIVKTPLQTKLEMAPLEKVVTPFKVNVEATPKAKMEVPSEVRMDALLNMEAPPMENMELSPVASTETSPLVSVEVSPVVSMDASSEVSLDTSPEGSMGSSPKVNMKAPCNANMEASQSSETLPEANVEVPLEGEVEESPKESLESSPKMVAEVSYKASPKKASCNKILTNILLHQPVQKPEMDRQTSNPVIKKHPSSNILSNMQSPSPASGCHPPSPVNTIRHIQKNRPPSPSPVLSKQSVHAPLPCKIIPVQRTLFVPDGIVKKKRETVSKSPNKCEPVSQKQMISEESGNKIAPGTMSAEEATKILAEKRRLAREQKDKKEEERLQKEMEPRKVADVIEKVDKGQAEELSKCEDGQEQEKEIKKNKGCQHQDQEKGDAKIKAQEEADKRKKEQERIMLQNLQERLERKKRIEEIMKRTRKTDVNITKASEISGSNTSEEDEADDEDETESDEDSLDKMFPSANGNGRESPNKPKMPYKNAKKMPQKLVFLQATTGETDKEKKSYFNGDLKPFRQKSLKESSTQAKGLKSSTKRSSTRTAKTGKAKELSTTTQSIPNVSTPQEQTYGKIDSSSHNTESPDTNVTPDSHKQNLKDFVTSHPNPQMPTDHKKKSQSVPANSSKASSHLCFAPKAVDLEPSPTSSSRAFFGGEEEDGVESAGML